MNLKTEGKKKLFHIVDLQFNTLEMKRRTYEQMFPVLWGDSEDITAKSEVLHELCKSGLFVKARWQEDSHILGNVK